jgi:hypothetical protein
MWPACSCSESRSRVLPWCHHNVYRWMDQSRDLLELLPQMLESYQLPGQDSVHARNGPRQPLVYATCSMDSLNCCTRSWKRTLEVRTGGCHHQSMCYELPNRYLVRPVPPHWSVLPGFARGDTVFSDHRKGSYRVVCLQCMTFPQGWRATHTAIPVIISTINSFLAFYFCRKVPLDRRI